MKIIKKRIIEQLNYYLKLSDLFIFIMFKIFGKIKLKKTITFKQKFF